MVFTILIGTFIGASLKIFENEIFSLFEIHGIKDRLNNDWNVAVFSLALDVFVIGFGGAIRGIG